MQGVFAPIQQNPPEGRPIRHRRPPDRYTPYDFRPAQKSPTVSTESEQRRLAEDVRMAPRVLSGALVQKGQTHDDIRWVQYYLRYFRYLRGDVRPGALVGKTVRALKFFQRLHQIEPTGDLDTDTIQALRQPRCGVLDTFRYEGNVAAEMVPSRVSPYFRRAFTYKLGQGTPDIAGDGEWQSVLNAFRTWQGAMNLTYAGISSKSKADCVIEWQPRVHGRSGHPDFDGPYSPNNPNDPNDDTGGVLAHANYPPPVGGRDAGQVHFDEDETWGPSGGNGTDTEAVALHEFGHFLGLDHSFDPNAVMFGTYSAGRIQLTTDDRTRIREHYPNRSLIPIGEHMIDYRRDQGEYRLWHVDSTKTNPLRGPVATGTWQTIQRFHELIPVGDSHIIDWEPHNGHYRLWEFDATKNDPLRGPVQDGYWARIRAGHQLIALGDHVVDWVPKTGYREVWRFNANSHDPLVGKYGRSNTPLVKGNWGIKSGETLVPIGQHVFTWTPQNGAYTLYKVGDKPESLLDYVYGHRWGSIRTGHQLVPLRGQLMLDWVPADKTYRRWVFMPDHPSDPLPVEKGSEQTFPDIGNE